MSRTLWIPLAFLLLCLLAGLASAAPASAEPNPAEGYGRLWIGEAALADLPPERQEARRARNRTNAAKALLAGLGVLTWLGVVWARRHPATARARDVMLASLGVVGLLGWWNFGQLHYPRFAHPHELVHYVIGAKYFTELGYTRLYECLVVADARAGSPDAVAAREITDLRTYTAVSAAPIVADPGRCTLHFTNERFALFERDVAWFRKRVDPTEWVGIQRDHGYNPTPVWGVLGRAFVGDQALDEARLATLAWLDPLLLFAMWGTALWAFGWRATSVALLFWGTNHPAEYGWVGGAYLRHDWLAASVIGLACVKRSQPLAGGLLLGASALLRVFPIVLFAPLVLRIAHVSWQQRRLRFPPTETRILAGAALSAVLLLPLSVWSAGHQAWPDFVENIQLHAATPSNTALGVGALLGFAPETREVALRTQGVDVDAAWKRAQREQRASRRPLQALLLGLGLLLVGRACRAAEPWEALVLGVGLVPLVVDVSSYYTALFAVYGFLAWRRPPIGVALCALSLLSWLAAGAWFAWDEISVATSAALLVFSLVATLAFGRVPANPSP